MKLNRISGILLHPTSLPSKYGIGSLGKEAYEFVDFLKAAKQKLWQILPLNPPGYGGSPYKSFSAFAGNTLLISIEKLFQDGLLKKEEIRDIPEIQTEKVNFKIVSNLKKRFFTKAFTRFRKRGKEQDYQDFKLKNVYWLEDFCFYMSLKEYFHGEIWNLWDKPVVLREMKAIKRYQEKLEDEINYHEFLQYIFSKQWLELKDYANQNKIRIIGDLPIFVAHDSSDLWIHPELFDLDENKNPRKVAGVPPDYFSKTGQLWGSPHFNWEKMKKNHFLWWKKRFENLFEQVDILRIDHFRGFEAYWEIDVVEKTAERGVWVKAPGHDLFSEIKRCLGELPIIIEDLGYITPEVIELKEKFGFPGMKILQFSFSENIPRKERPEGYEKQCVAYTGTHDNDTILGWYRKIKKTKNKQTLKLLEERYGISQDMKEKEICWTLIELLYKTEASFVIVPLQDVLCLDNHARMNYPGTVGGNWEWQFKERDISEEIIEKLSNLVPKHYR